MNKILSVKDGSLKIANNTIIRGVSFDIPVNKKTVIIGPSGSGKTSLLKGIVQLLPLTGEILFDGNIIKEYNILELRRQVIYVSQIPVVFSGTVAENVNWGRKLWDLPKVDASEYLQQVGLSDTLSNRNASNLSVGQQQRLHLARSLALKPRILLLDEPASALDAISKESFENLIIELMKNIEDLAIVLITHDLGQAKRIADYVILLVDGQIQLQGSANVFFEEVKGLSEADMLRELMKKEDN